MLFIVQVQKEQRQNWNSRGVFPGWKIYAMVGGKLLIYTCMYYAVYKISLTFMMHLILYIVQK
jgi:hypothetical protein